MHASAGWYGDHTVNATSDGVTVRKGLDLDTLALPALKFEIRSERDDPVGVRVVDRLPATIDPERVAVHADFAADQWTAFEDGRVTFTTRLDPERPVVTLYGIWMDDPSRVHELLGRPEVKVASNPDAPSLEPVGDEIPLRTVNDSLRSVGPDALADLRSDVEEALTAVRANPTEEDAESAGDAQAEPAGTMGDHAWTYPVERTGTGRIATPTHANLNELVDDVGEDHVYLRAALTETHHGGGGALLLQELANAFEVVARRVTGDDERSTVDAVVHTPLGTDAVLSALSEREQVTDALVSQLVGDRDDATGIDATAAEETAAADRDGTDELSLEPDTEDVEVVLNADGQRFDELKQEFEHETDTDTLEDELTDLDLPGVDTADEPSIDDLIADGEGVDDDGDDETTFVPASVDAGADDSAFEFDDGESEDTLDFSSDDGGNPSGLDFATDAETADDATGTAGGANAPDDAAESDGPFEFQTDDAFEPADVTEDAAAADAGAGVDAESTPSTADETELDVEERGQADVEATPETVEVPADELAALRTELRELRDRVATLESDLAAVRATEAPATPDDSTAESDGDGGSGHRPGDGGEDRPGDDRGSPGAGPDASETASEDTSTQQRDGGAPDGEHSRNGTSSHERPVAEGDGSVEPVESDPFETLDPVERADDAE